MAAFSHNGEPGSALDAELKGHDTRHREGYAAGFRAGREAGMREASEICKKRADWILTRQDGKPEELSNVILRHHASAHVSAQEEILSAIDK